MGRADARTRFEHEVAVPSGAAVTRPSLFAQQTFFILKLDLDNLLVLHMHPGDTNGETTGSSVEFYRSFWGQATRWLAGSYRVASLGCCYCAGRGRDLWSGVAVCPSPASHTVTLLATTPPQLTIPRTTYTPRQDRSVKINCV